MIFKVATTYYTTMISILIVSINSQDVNYRNSRYVLNAPNRKTIIPDKLIDAGFLKQDNNYYSENRLKISPKDSFRTNFSPSHRIPDSRDKLKLRFDEILLPNYHLNFKPSKELRTRIDNTEKIKNKNNNNSNYYEKHLNDPYIVPHKYSMFDRGWGRPAFSKRNSASVIDSEKELLPKQKLLTTGSRSDKSKGILIQEKEVSPAAEERSPAAEEISPKDREFQNVEEIMHAINDLQREENHEAHSSYRGWSGKLNYDKIDPIFKGLYEIANHNHKNKTRSKRFIRILPRRSAFNSKWTLSIPSRKVTLYKSGWGLAFSNTIRLPAFLRSLVRRRKKRSIESDNEKENRLRRKQKEKLSVFKQLENYFKSMGMPSRQCLLRTICDIAERPLLNGLAGEVVNSLFSFSKDQNTYSEKQISSKTKNIKKIDRHYEHFLNAENHGKNFGNCQEKFRNCSTSVFEYLPIFVENLF